MDDQKQIKIFSDNLKKYMDLKNKKQVDLINDLGFKKPTVSSWCTGRRIPRMSVIQQLADYLGVSTVQLTNDVSAKQLTFEDFEEFKDIKGCDYITYLNNDEKIPIIIETKPAKNRKVKPVGESLTGQIMEKVEAMSEDSKRLLLMLINNMK